MRHPTATGWSSSAAASTATWSTPTPTADGPPDILQLQMVPPAPASRAPSRSTTARRGSHRLGLPGTGLVDPQIGVAAYNGTGSEIGVFDYFTLGESRSSSPDTCEATAADPGYPMLFDGTRPAWTTGRWPVRRLRPRGRLLDQDHRRTRAALARRADRRRLLAPARLEDAQRQQRRRLRRASPTPRGTDPGSPSPRATRSRSTPPTTPTAPRARSTTSSRPTCRS